MEMKLTLPDEVLDALGGEPEREVLEGVLLLLVGEGKMPLKRAGGILGFESDEAATRWYAERTGSRPDPDPRDIAQIDEIVHLEDLTQEELDGLDRFLDIPPASKGSGLSDVSVNHDKYLSEGAS